MFIDRMVKQNNGDDCQVGGQIPMISKDDYGAWLALILMKPEVVKFHRIDDRDIFCEKRCSLCAKGLHPIISWLLPVYNVDKDIVKLLRVDAIGNPGSLFEQMCNYMYECNSVGSSVYCHEFYISESYLKTECHDGDSKHQRRPVSIFRNWAVRFCQKFHYHKKAVAHFLNNYNPGDLEKSADFYYEAG
jgi:hypothetical protein